MTKRNTTGIPKRKRRTREEEAPAEESSGSATGNLLNNLITAEGKTRAERESEIQRLIWIGTAVIVAILVVLVAVALLWEQVFVPQQTVAVVNGERISIGEFEQRVRLERVMLNQRFNNDIALLIQLGQDPNAILQQEQYANWWQEITGQPELLGSRVLNDMIDEKIVRKEAAERGITVDQEAVNTEAEQFFNFFRPDDEAAVEDPTETPIPSDTPTPFVSPTPSSTPAPTNTPEATPTPLAEEEVATEESGTPQPTARPTGTPTATPSFEERAAEIDENINVFYRNASREAGLSESTVRQYFEYQALLDALREEVTADIGAEGEFVNARHILVATEEEAQDVLAALENGESFANLARAQSLDTGSGARGGELDWTPTSTFVAEFRTAVEEAPIGEVVGPVQTEFGYHIIQVRAREQRELSEFDLEQAKSIAFSNWLEELTSDENNEIVRRDNWPAHVPLNPQFVYRPTGQEVPTPVQ